MSVEKNNDSELQGADSMIYERLSPTLNSEAFKAITQKHLEDFATKGLRTLCCAVADISEKSYEVAGYLNSSNKIWR